MTFSEYIRVHAYKAYLSYCKQKSLEPNIDIKVTVPEKLCALVLPKIKNP